MRKGFTLVELIVVIALISLLTASVFAWYNEFKDKQIVDTNGDGLVYYDDITLPKPPNYREILKQYGIDVGELTDEELNELIKELQNGTSD
jgi:prepilin-type N-terminal cleavage/methylation domain-containing protein|nr:MAG TPA: type II secretion system protein [Caudoviricetes sp.]